MENFSNDEQLNFLFKQKVETLNNAWPSIFIHDDKIEYIYREETLEKLKQINKEIDNRIEELCILEKE